MTTSDAHVEDVAAAFDPDSEHAWANAFPDPDIRAVWRDSQFNAVEASQWSRWHSRNAANLWVSYGVEPSAARSWHRAGLRISEVAELRWTNEDPEVILAPWSDARIAGVELLTALKERLSPDEVALLRAQPWDASPNLLKPDWVHAVETTKREWPAGKLARFIRVHGHAPLHLMNYQRAVDAGDFNLAPLAEIAAEITRTEATLEALKVDRARLTAAANENGVSVNDIAAHAGIEPHRVNELVLAERKARDRSWSDAGFSHGERLGGVLNQVSVDDAITLRDYPWGSGTELGRAPWVAALDSFAQTAEQVAAAIRETGQPPERQPSP